MDQRFFFLKMTSLCQSSTFPDTWNLYFISILITHFLISKIYIYIYTYSDDTRFGKGVSISYPFLKKCQLHPNFLKSVSIRSLSNGSD